MLLRLLFILVLLLGMLLRLLFVLVLLLGMLLRLLLLLVLLLGMLLRLLFTAGSAAGHAVAAAAASVLICLALVRAVRTQEQRFPETEL